jgi:hypothetical protein
VSVGAGVHRKQLVADPEGGLAPGFDILRFGKAETELTEAGQGLERHERAMGYGLWAMGYGLWAMGKLIPDGSLR